MRILAVDPGGSTGWCYTSGKDIITSGTAAEWRQFCDMVETLLDDECVDQIVIETYEITMETVKKTRQYEALMIIGVMHWMAAKYSVPIKVQARSIKAFSTDNKLKNLGWWEGRSVHERDALRHLLAFLWDNDMIQAEEFLDGNS